MTENLLNYHDVVQVLNSRQFYAELHYLKIMLAFIVDYVGEGESRYNCYERLLEVYNSGVMKTDKTGRDDNKFL